MSERLRKLVGILGVASLVASAAVFAERDVGAETDQLVLGVARPAEDGPPAATAASAESGSSAAPPRTGEVAASSGAQPEASPASVAAIAGSPRSHEDEVDALSRGQEGRRAEIVFATTIDGEPAGDVPAIVAPNDVLVHARELENAGLAAPPAAAVVVAGENFVSLSALGPASTHTLDEEKRTLAITVPPTLFRPQHVSVQPVGISSNPRSAGAFVNYGVTAATGSTISATGQLAAAFAGGVVQSTFSRDASTHGRLSGTSFTIDDFRGARRLVMGQSYLDVNDFAGLGGPLNIQGVALHRLLGYNPSLIRHAANGFSGVASTPSTVEVYVNGSLVWQEHINPGPFQLSNLPLEDGANHARVVIRDAFGHVEQIDRPMYLAGDLIPRGEREYELGFGRDVSSGRLVGAARYERGLTRNVTFAARALTTPQIRNAGASLVVGTGFGELSLAAATSAARADVPSSSTVIDATGGESETTPTPADTSVVLSGRAYAASFSRNAGRFSGGATFVWQSPQYASTANSPLSDRPLQDAHLFANVDLGGPRERSLSLNAQRTVYRDASPLRSLSLGFSEKITPRLRASIAVGTSAIGSLVRPSLRFAFTALLRGRRLTYSSESSSTHAERHVALEHDVDGLFGTSYQARFGLSDDQRDDSLAVQTRGRWSELDLSAARSGQSTTASATLSGSLAHLGGRWFASRTIGDAYALIDTGLPNVQVKVNGTAIGSTDRYGRLLAPTLGSNQDNLIELNGQALSKATLLEATSLLTVPAYHGGTVVRFQAKRARPVTGHLRLRDAPEKWPENGHFDVQTKLGVASTVVGPLGSFAFEQFPPGSYDGTVQWVGGKCIVHLVIPTSKQARTDLGNLVCRPE